MTSNRFFKGFTLIETMVAVSILTLAVAGPLTTASRAIVASQAARDQFVASYLAQEGIEYVRAMRDNEYLAAYGAGGSNVSSVAWNNFLEGSMPSNPGAIRQCRGETCTLDPTRIMGSGSGFALVPCSGSSCTPLYIANNIYTQQSGIVGSKLTPFTRTVQAFVVSTTEMRIVSKVSWSFHGIPYSVSATGYLTTWQ